MTIILFISLCILLIITNIHIVPVNEQWIIERSHKFYNIWNSGIHITIPIIDKIINKVNLNTQIQIFDRIIILTEDNTQFTPNIIVEYNIIDIERFTYQERRPILTLEKDVAKIIRYATGIIPAEHFKNNIHSIENQTLTELNTFTNYYGINVNRLVIEIKETL